MPIMDAMKNILPIATALCLLFSCAKKEDDKNLENPENRTPMGNAQTALNDKAEALDLKIDASDMDAFNKSMAPFRSVFESMTPKRQEEINKALINLAFDAYKQYPKRASIKKENLESLREFDRFSIKLFDGKSINEVLAVYENFKVSPEDQNLWEEFEMLMTPPNGR